MKEIHWYPGHMKKTRELIEKNLKLVDAVLELTDARIPVSSRIQKLENSRPNLLESGMFSPEKSRHPTITVQSFSSISG